MTSFYRYLKKGKSKQEAMRLYDKGRKAEARKVLRRSANRLKGMGSRGGGAGGSISWTGSGPPPAVSSHPSPPLTP